MKKYGKWFLENIGPFFTIVAVVLLVLVANLDSLSGWFAVAAWMVLALRVWVWFEDNRQDEGKVAPVVLTFVLAIAAAIFSQRFQTNVLTVLRLPTLENLEKLTASSPFLFLVACYFAMALLSAKTKIHEAEIKYEELKRARSEEIALYQGELKNLKEKILAEFNKARNN